MRLPALLLIFAYVGLAAPPAQAETADILIQAGHQGRPASCAPHHVVACNLGTGAQGVTERDWTPLVADEAAAALRAAGYTVIRRPADYDEHDTVRAAIFLHFDGASPACGSGASAGFPTTTSRAFIEDWETRYRAWFPYTFKGENITTNESRYYGFRKVDAPEKLLIEFGEMTCPQQFAWMAPRVHEFGPFLAKFLEAQVPR
ncbi:MAG TPA: hypothetical protein VGN14_17985 [Candidatus Elarobacter sp.]|jgi:hypothetical protein